MTTTTTAPWSRFAAAEPELAAAIAGRFAAHRHHVLATLRRDGSPRASGTEVVLRDGELWLGMVPGSRKALDLRRDPRFALHSAPLETDLAAGDAKVSGRAVEVVDRDAVQAFLAAEAPEGPTEALLFRLELVEASLVRVRGDELVIDGWRVGRGARRVVRR